ncbi:hypothetical protein [Aquabacter spiritensis]|nr:hypothetical protein [Aquabacter spiritensis]
MLEVTGSEVVALVQPPDEAANPAVPDPQTLARLKDEVARILLAEPLSGTARRLLGVLTQIEGNTADTERLMIAAVRRTLHEAPAALWLMDHYLRTKTFKDAVRYADIVARTYLELIPLVMPLLVRALDDPEGRAAVGEELAANPPWRASFFAYLPHFTTDATTPLALAQDLAKHGSPPTETELAPWLNLLLAKKLYDVAYYTWLQFLPPDELAAAGYLFNGDFAFPLTSVAFNWVLGPGSGVTVETVRQPLANGDRGLFVEFGQGRVEFGEVYQVVLLQPGTYTFSGRYKGNPLGSRGLQWRVLCYGEDKVLAASQLFNAPVPDWRNFSFTFSVPKAGCRAQRVQLHLPARIASEQFMSGVLWYGELKITRTPERRS